MTRTEPTPARLPFRLLLLGLGGMAATSFALLASTMLMVLAGMPDRVQADLARQAAIVRHIVQDRPSAPAGALLASLQPLLRADVAVLEDGRVAATRGFPPAGHDGAPMLALPRDPHTGSLREGLERVGAMRERGGADASWYYLRALTLPAPPGHASRVLVLGVPLSMALGAAAAIARGAGLAAILVVPLLGLLFLRVGGRLARAIAATQLALDHANAGLQATMRSLDHGLYICDAAGRLVSHNDRCATILGVDPSALSIGGTLRFLPGPANDTDLQQIDAFLGQRPDMNEAQRAGGVNRRTMRNRHGRPILVTEHPMDGGGWLALLEDLDEGLQAQTEMRYLREFDDVTRLPNREHLKQKLQHALDACAGGTELQDRPWPALLKIDLARYRTLHDGYGEAKMATLLNQIRERLERCLRAGDVLARVRMDEFAVLPVALRSRQEAGTLAGRLLAQINDGYDVDGTPMSINARIGIALAPDHGTSADQLMKSAALALQLSPVHGIGWQLYEPHMEGVLADRLALEIDLGQALSDGAFDLYYQPLIDLRHDRVCCLEALLRWPHPARGMVSPLDFIPIAEQTGQIVPLGAWVLERACRDAMGWPCDVRVAVNLSAIQVREAGLLATVQGALARSGLVPERLELEVTETVLLEGDPAAKRALHELRALGVRISMDDFGTGHASLSYLRDFPFDKIKIDRSFVQHMLERQDCLAIVRAVTMLAGSLGMSVTAEGAETAAQVERLRAEGCHEVQGFFYSRPRPLAEVPGLFARDYALAS